MDIIDKVSRSQVNSLSLVMWEGFIASVEGLKKKHQGPPQKHNKEFHLQSTFKLNMTSSSASISSLPTCTADLGLASILYCISEFLKA